MDLNTQEPLIGTNVQIIDTNKGAATDMEGKYVIQNVPVGTYRLKFDYIGYESIIKTDVVVISARPARCSGLIFR